MNLERERFRAVVADDEGRGASAVTARCVFEQFRERSRDEERRVAVEQTIVRLNDQSIFGQARAGRARFGRQSSGVELAKRP